MIIMALASLWGAPYIATCLIAQVRGSTTSLTLTLRVAVDVAILVRPVISVTIISSLGLV